MPAFHKAEESKYGFHYFDKPNEGIKGTEDDDEDEDEEFDLPSCTKNCCDADCECDDCLRCSTNGIRTDEDDYDIYPAAAA